MALQSAKSANLDVPDTVLELAGHYLDSCQHDGGAIWLHAAKRADTHDDRRSVAMSYVSRLDA